MSGARIGYLERYTALQQGINHDGRPVVERQRNRRAVDRLAARQQPGVIIFLVVIGRIERKHEHIYRRSAAALRNGHT